jgi:hypothetical protein
MNPLSGDLTFVDASGGTALVNASDTLHQQSVRLFQQRLNEGRGFVTSSLVLLEVGNWPSPVPLRRLASGLMERIEHSTRIQVVELTPELYRNRGRFPLGVQEFFLSKRGAGECSFFFERFFFFEFSARQGHRAPPE